MLFRSLEKRKEAIFAEKGIEGARAQMRAMAKISEEALEYLALAATPIKRRDAARFGFLIWMPILLGSCVWHARDLIGLQPFPTAQVVIGFVVAFMLTLTLISILMTWLRRHSFTPFALYRMLIGLNLLIVVYDLI